MPGATLYQDARQGSIVDLVLGEQFRRLSTPAELARGRQGLLAPAGTGRRDAGGRRRRGAARRRGRDEAGADEAGPAAGRHPSRSPGC